jgi:hypothetical protein
MSNIPAQRPLPPTTATKAGRSRAGKRKEISARAPKMSKARKKAKAPKKAKTTKKDT